MTRPLVALIATLLAAPAAAQPVEAPPPVPRLVLDTSLYAQARGVARDGEDLGELRLDRGELGARFAIADGAAAELRLEAVRSAIEGGALGVDGNSLVVRVRIAQITGSATLGPVEVTGAIGVAPDPWIRTVEDGYTLRPLSRTTSERLLGWSPADLAAIARATLGPASLTVAVANGEGLRFPERNTGKTTTGVLRIVAVDAAALRLSFAAVGRDGSIGVASLRDRRVGGAVMATTPWLRAGADVVQAWGIGERAEAEGLAVTGWAEVDLLDRLAVSARGATLGYETGGRSSTFGGAISAAPWASTSGRTRVWLALDRVTSSGGAMPVVGGDAGDATVVMLIASSDTSFSPGQEL